MTGGKRKILFLSSPFILSSNPMLVSAAEEALHEKVDSAELESPVKQILSVKRQGHISVIISAYFS